ncbi:hypothetical protein N7455_007953 [Penicillium solitum]|uniref:uncharacterized protein n=1 Tax=Penicillium solitum TaxID=60172 RepID=UPI0017F31914|nr:hypothetical protein HAV15_004411 [Penicillium sp. str. \
MTSPSVLGVPERDDKAKRGPKSRGSQPTMEGFSKTVTTNGWLWTPLTLEIAGMATQKTPGFDHHSGCAHKIQAGRRGSPRRDP